MSPIYSRLVNNDTDSASRCEAGIIRCSSVELVSRYNAISVGIIVTLVLTFRPSPCFRAMNGNESHHSRRIHISFLPDKLFIATCRHGRGDVRRGDMRIPPPPSKQAPIVARSIHVRVVVVVVSTIVVFE